jgi:hypothetical protein
MNGYPTSLQSEALMAHMQAICKGIGPRPPTSKQERQAADYVENTLHSLGISNIQRQAFRSPNSSGWVTVPCFAAGLVGTILAIFAGQWGKIIGGILLLISAYVFRQVLLVVPPFFEGLIARWTSQNVIAKMPAENQAQQTIYLVGHLDSQKQRFQFPSSPFWIMKSQTSLPVVAGLVGGTVLLVEALLNLQITPQWLWLLEIAYLYGLSGALYDETQPYVEGANDNATAVSLLLGIAQALKTQPLQNTEVVFLFTGCEEAGCVGMEGYLHQYAPPTDNTFWIDIEMVGAGNLCFITRHGISYLSAYLPHPAMVEFAERVARKYPDLEITGKEMVIIEEIANLSRKKYKAICLSGYNAEGVLPNWHRLSDNLHNIEPDVLSQAACYTWELMREIDHHCNSGENS